MTPEPAGEAGSDVAPSLRGRVRTLTAAVCGVLAVVVLEGAVFGTWARATILDTSTTGSIAHDIAEEPEVQAALATTLSELVVDHLRLPDDVVAELPPALDELRPALRAGVDELVERVFRAVLDDPLVPDVVARMAMRAHDAALRLLSGDGIVDGVSVADGEVSLNLLPLLSRGLIELERRGVSAVGEIPELAVDGDPDEQVAALEAATGRDLPDDFGQLVIYRTDQVGDGGGTVGAAQQLTVVARRGLFLLVAAAIVLLAATIVLARNRLAAAVRLGVGIAAVSVVARAAVGDVVDDGPELAHRPSGRAVVEAVLESVTPGLVRISGVVLLVAAVAVAVASSRRGWPHEDLVLVVTAGTGLAVVALLGFSVWTLLAGLAAALLVIPVSRRLRSS
ncbi:hypothetical protein [Desertimonas flava]|uniref:hypothetical protein n=1 Tax=Desertimonas flava TaxID=2064846 RepID=UPI000E3551DE|nr:hypothetical protein [Desertimonas flava]